MVTEIDKTIEALQDFQDALQELLDALKGLKEDEVIEA